MASAKYYARGIVMNLGMDFTHIGVGPAAELYDELPYTVKVIRNLSTIMDGVEPMNIPLEIQSVDLYPRDELLATIQNIDHFFTEQKPYFMSFDYNIIYQALKMIIDKGLASKKLLDLRCNEIKEIILELVNDDEKPFEINPQLYIQFKSLLDFEPKMWIKDLIEEIEIERYLKKIIEIEEEEIQKKENNDNTWCFHGALLSLRFY